MRVAPLTDYAAVQDYLFSLKAKGVKFGVDRMRSWIGALGHPEKKTPCIHITGTNGKGSTAAMLATIFQAHGLRVGLYTSPHLVRLGERVQVDRTALTESEIVNFTNELRPIAESVSALQPDDHPSFFEFMTAMAFLQFARKGCDISIIEVGLGGRLDATNVVEPKVSVITSISLDHCEMLGNTIEAIAREKAGIIKAGRPVVLGHLPLEAERIIRGVAQEVRSPVITIAEKFGGDLQKYPRSRLEGDYQRWNAATAVLAADQLRDRWLIPQETIERALLEVDWPGRWERVELGGRPLILDASHNPEGASVLDSALQKLVAQFGRAPIIIAGVLGAARATPLIETICRHAKEIHFVVPNQSRACTHDELVKLVPSTYRGKIVRATIDSLFPNASSCTAGEANDVLVVTGSIYLLGEVLARIQPERGSNEGRLQDF